MPTLQALDRARLRPALVITQPDRPGHRLRMTAPAVKTAALELGLEVFQPERIRDSGAVERLRELDPEVLVVVAYGQIIPAPVLAIPSRGTFNVHASLLPRWRGAAPVAHAILAGDRVTGVTVMAMDEQLDHGPILAVREAEIGPGEDAPSLSGRLAGLGADLMVEVLGDLDRVEPREQDHAAATLAPKLRREDGELDWARSAEEIDRRVRAFKPWPGVTLPFAGRRVKVIAGRPTAGMGEEGAVLSVSAEGVEVAARTGAYLLQEVQPPGGRPMPARALATAGS